jgi:hypothetical protein
VDAKEIRFGAEGSRPAGKDSIKSGAKCIYARLRGRRRGMATRAIVAACHDANINVAIQMLMECLLISILAATRDPAEAQTAVDEVARVMCSNVQRAWQEFAAMRRGAGH